MTTITLVQSDTIPVLRRTNKTTPHNGCLGYNAHFQIQTDGTRIRSHPIEDGIHDKGLNEETFPTGGVPRPQ